MEQKERKRDWKDIEEERGKGSKKEVKVIPLVKERRNRGLMTQGEAEKKRKRMVKEKQKERKKRQQGK